ncbi:glycoside hydrolase domain-containing protein [Atopobiaceae bacterium 24-176]
MSDSMVLETQQWLNATYGNDSRFKRVAEDGLTGWGTINGLIRALQIELGIQATADNFGAGTESRFKEAWPNGVAQQADTDTTENNVYAIIQGALWCKGYSTGSHITRHFYGGTGSAVRQLKADMGIDGDSTVDVDVMKSLLSMKQFVLLSNMGGKSQIRLAQQRINRDYRAYTGIVPTDGLYGREMNTALIQVLQALEGFTPAEATGNFGSGTRSRLKTIDASNSLENSQWVWLGSVALVCNGENNQIGAIWSSELQAAISLFQGQYALPSTNILDSTTWMSLLTSKGNPDRPAVACDTRFEMTQARIDTLKANGYRIVGRYLTEPGQASLDPADYFKAIRPGELERIVSSGMSYFPIFQENARQLSDFTAAKGASHAQEAAAAAERLGIPPTVIYYAVDMDLLGNQIDPYLVPYFQAIRNNSGRYGVGIYGSRNVCSQIIQKGLAVTAFVSDMSTGFSGNLGFSIPDQWNFDQFAELGNYKGQGWDLDRVAWSGRWAACDSVGKAAPAGPVANPDMSFLEEWIESASKLSSETLDILGLSSQKPEVGNFILQWMRKPKYWPGSGTSEATGAMWFVYTPEPVYDSARSAVAQACDKISAEMGGIKKSQGVDLHYDAEHMAATALGYRQWGIEAPVNDYGLGDLGGWALDLLSVWGTYKEAAPVTGLSEWLSDNIGKNDACGFGADDAVADADAWLIARHMKDNPGASSLAVAAGSMYARSAAQRVALFYKERFGGNAGNVAQAFRKLVDGIDAGGFENIPLSADVLKRAAKTTTLPTPEEAGVMGFAYGAFMAAQA